MFCKEDDGSDSVYIGEAENVKERLIQHLRDYQAENEKYYWSTAVIFIGRDLNKALIRYLENRFVEIARVNKRCHVLTQNTYENTVMKESQVAVMEEFIYNVKILVNALGYKVSEPLVQNNSSNSTVDEEIFFISSGSVNAKGRVTTEGFVVYEGSTLDSKGSVNSLSNGMKNLRQKLIESDKVQNHVIKENFLFSSSSAAASFVLGYSVSGPQRWKNVEKNLKLNK